jgi:Mrp family chromosome partitioning ATPase/DUF971 family protein
MVRQVQVAPNSQDVTVQLQLSTDYRQIKKQIEALSVPGFGRIKVFMAPEDKKTSESSAGVGNGMQKIKKIFAVSSCKGGVGKSTVAVNFAYTLSRLFDLRVGILDADVYGPSLPTMVSPEDLTIRESEVNSSWIAPLHYKGVSLMSFGWIKQLEKSPAILRGPIVSSITSQLGAKTDWGQLDALVVDFPPGTGDILITLCQQIRFSGAIIVTTPQKLSYVDVVKGIEMFQKVKVPTLAIVQNMSFFTCSECSSKSRPFGKGHLDLLKREYGIKNSFEFPIVSEVSQFSDSGDPVVLQDSVNTEEIRKLYLNLAQTVLEEEQSLKAKPTPTVTYNSDQQALELKYPDGRQVFLNPVQVRKSCQCASCVDEYTGKSLILDHKIPSDVHPRKIEEKGNYAVAIFWSDGHSSSIYPYESLEKLNSSL